MVIAMWHFMNGNSIPNYSRFRGAKFVSLIALNRHVLFETLVISWLLRSCEEILAGYRPI